MASPHRLVALLLALSLIACGSGVEAAAAAKQRKGKKGQLAATAKPEKKGKPVAAKPGKGKKGAAAKPRPENKGSSRGRVAGRGRRGREARAPRRASARRREAAVVAAAPEVEIVPARLSLPDRIEVIENASATFNPPPRPAVEPADRPFNISTRKIDVNISPDRVTAIQQALAGKGCYAGEPTGLYDEATVEAMRQFQTMSRIDVTGYPTAHSLKRLGLTHW
jgi:Putative peptidoglycan binding domain